MIGVYFLEIVFTFWEVKCSFTLHLYHMCQIQTELIFRRISILSFNQISSCAWPATSQLLCTLPGFHTCVRLFFVLIWKKWLLEKCLHAVFIVCPVCPEMRFESAPLTVSLGPLLPCPVERQEHVPAGSWWGNKGEIALGALSLHTLEWGLYLGPHGWHPQE